jgi:2-polyprenyl-3-methyl-5-hydroxy-6-metoxy-1,4-benzoquinol methylase
MKYVTENKQCLACGSGNIHTALDLGKQPLANNYKDSANVKNEKYPLGVRLCYECFHLQLSHTVDPEIIYKNYLYATGTNQTIKDYSKWFADFCLESCAQANTVLDIGCNDGTQLDYFKQLGVRTYGIDPAENLHNRSSANHNVVCDFFGPAAVEKLNKVYYDLIIAQNVCAHNPNPQAFLESCYKLMADHTVLFVQTSQADMVLHNEFDTIYHEHVNFFNTNSMHKLAQRVGLHVIDVVKTPIHGNSYIFILSKHPFNKNRVDNIVAMEHSYGLLNLETYTKWEQYVQGLVKKLKTQINTYRRQGYTIVGYGAAAKGMTLLNFSNIELDFIIDDSPLKQGKFTPGAGCAIVGIERLKKFKAKDKILFMPLAWNFFPEIKSKIQTARNNPNDLFIRYFPEVEISN